VLFFALPVVLVVVLSLRFEASRWVQSDDAG